jgi:8-oxo-dGTP pyrophosphatase MutT (NUDIX family)
VKVLPVLGSLAVSEQERFARWGKVEPGAEPAPIVPAATVILLRDTADGLETLMLRRNSKIAFGGMWVFPGGRVDPEDFGTAPDDVDAASRNAAAREAHEESGLTVSVDALVPLSHWTPPPEAPKRFATQFFVAPAPDGVVVIDDGEIHESMWVAPAEAMRRRDALEIELAPPTFVSLHTLAAHATVAQAIDATAAAETEHFTTRIGTTDEGLCVMWHGDAGYEDGDATRDGPRHRLWMADAGWRYERS